MLCGMRNVRFQLLLVDDLYENQTLKILNFISESPGSMKDISEHLQLDFFLIRQLNYLSQDFQLFL